MVVAKSNVDRKRAISSASTRADTRTRTPPRLITLLLLVCSSFLWITEASSGSATVKTSSSLVVSSANPVITEPAASSQNSGGGGNPVFNLVGYVKNSIVKTVDSCGQLWSNYGKCNEIRKCQKEYRNRIANQWELQGLYQDESRRQIQQRLQSVQGGIPYSDYVFLQKSKEDRSKVLNILFLMWGAPRFLPYALMFNPEMLPSPFTQDRHAQQNAMSLESPAHRISRERTVAIMKTLADLERSALSGAAGGFFSKLNIFGRQKQNQQQQRLVNIYNETKSMLLKPPTAHGIGSGGASSLESADDHSPPGLLKPILEKLAYRDGEDFTRAEQRLCDIPACIVKGMGQAITGAAAGGVLSQIQPHFLQRGKVVSHLRKVTEADDFLVQANVDLDTISPRLLQEACSDRMMGGPDWSPEDLKDGLQEWLRLAVREPANLLEERASAGTDPTDSVPLYYNGNTMRFTLMAFYACQGSQGVGRLEPTLPQLLLKPNGASGKADTKLEKIQAKKSSDSSSDVGGSKKGFFRR